MVVSQQAVVASSDCWTSTSCLTILPAVPTLFPSSGPCLIMAPEFEAAAQELKGKVRFVKLDTDKNEAMAARLNIMGLPTLLFLEKFVPKEGEKDQPASAVLRGRVEGAMQKKSILDLVDHHFFGGPAPKLF
jgi:thiol-disulfide isomerase/thioredoxin